ncbi:hypothetical protein [Nocardia altamirensis]|uniref:hypothetical protein n=1 Tax=Nocardia altamirensis TaxID=472158 RepID=UPI0008407E07|nr:hypothetical protein [Nocardia altamirensis]
MEVDTVDHKKTFRAAWEDSANTTCELPPLDVNQVLADRYELASPLIFTRTMLWDMEIRKSRRPDIYIPYVVSGAAQSWGEDDIFVRSSTQRLWLAPETYGLVLEQTHLDHANQIVTFIGAAEVPGPDGELLHAGTGQPVFHVEHGVSGTEERPLNTWRIVSLTETPDPRFVEVFDRIAASPYLPGFLEIYIREVLEIELTRR